MTTVIWKKISTIQIPNQQNAAWTPVPDILLLPNRTYKISVKDASKWSVDDKECSADGIGEIIIESQQPPPKVMGFLLQIAKEFVQKPP